MNESAHLTLAHMKFPETSGVRWKWTHSHEAVGRWTDFPLQQMPLSTNRILRSWLCCWVSKVFFIKIVHGKSQQLWYQGGSPINQEYLKALTYWKHRVDQWVWKKRNKPPYFHAFKVWNFCLLHGELDLVTPAPAGRFERKNKNGDWCIEMNVLSSQGKYRLLWQKQYKYCLIMKSFGDTDIFNCRLLYWKWPVVFTGSGQTLNKCWSHSVGVAASMSSTPRISTNWDKQLPREIQCPVVKDAVRDL